MFSSRMSSSDTLSRYFTSARRLLPCAAMRTCLPARMSGAIASCQYGRNRATVSFSDSVSGSSDARERGVPPIARGMTRIVGRQRRRRDVVAAAPDLDLRFAVLRSRFGLVQPLQRAVVPLVQTATSGRPESTSGPSRRGRSRACGSRASARTCARRRTRISRPPSAGRPRALPARPLSFRSTSVQPVNRFSWFQTLSPWRSRTSRCIDSLGPAQADATDDG